ncbi:hypothetical protein NEOLEDRAFT_1058952 [Neolentinus lepideus HHB14362 ss-1]|uniref:Family A G protein-coupled receptor-like protein n=1 Tax=Neolentinus lepideus HHB14362 ss-1 TaxID=1314782 RepID=A0A165UKR9_9AGAM|nr:hypothetical protein NEOLEDRAFT_1058952 [Neolentinus lepideus HHB14362 ss-1]
MEGGISLAEAVILSLSLESILYGASVCMFGATLWVLCYKHASPRTTRFMIIAACALFLFSTMHVSTDIARLIIAFVHIGSTNPGGIELWLGRVSQKTYMLKTAFYILQTLTGDAVIASNTPIYRCHMVYRSYWIILGPFILWCSVVAMGSAVLYTFATTSTNVFARRTTIWVSSFWGSTLATNLTSTILLAYRIWRVDRSVAETRTNSSLRGVVRVVLDAGALYSVTLLSALIPFICKSEGQYVVLDMITPIISIAFYMVLIRVGLANGSAPLSSSANRSRGSTAPTMHNHYSMRPLEVHISQLMETDQRGTGRSDSSVLDKSV